MIGYANLVQVVSDESLIGMDIVEYHITKYLGSGSTGSVYIGTNKNNKYALKFIKLQDVDDNFNLMINNEIKMMNTLAEKCDDYFTCFEESFIYQDYYIIVTKLIPGEALSDFIKNNQEPDNYTKLEIMFNLSEAVKFIHEKGCSHRDIQPKNIMINNNRVHLIDFGLSCCDQCSLKLSRYVQYLSLIRDINDDSVKTAQEQDIWALGIVFYQIVIWNVKKFPYNIYQLKYINNVDLDLIEEPFFSIIRGMLQIDDDKRLNIYDVAMMISYVKSIY